jgi:polysaccharide biosynthesis/export protein
LGHSSIIRSNPVIILLILLAFSCVPNKKVVYLQNKSVKKPYTKDSAVSVYPIQPYTYKLRAGDVIALNIASLTDKEFDFFDEYAERLGPVMSTNNARNPLGSSGMNNNINSQLSGNNTNSRNQISFIVNDSGNVELPIIGIIQLKGLSMKQAEDSISKASAKYFEKPTVRLNLLSFQFTILGEISTEGVYRNYNPQLNLLEAISLAGTLTEFADRANIKIIRKENGIEKVIYVNILEEKFLLSPYYHIQPDDIIIVPPLRLRTFKKYGIGNYTTLMSVISSLFVIYFTISQIK